jgi:hypothetical protein
MIEVRGHLGAQVDEAASQFIALGTGKQLIVDESAR